MDATGECQGQSVIFPVFEQVGEALGAGLLRWAANDDASSPTTASAA